MSSQNIRISAIVCTFRNPKLLDCAIDSLVKQDLSLDQFEIIVVDNNSQDETPEIVERFIKSNGDHNIRYLHESRQGLSFSRNAGIEISQGEIIAFLDDDAEADPNWLAALLAIYAQDDNIWAVGGKLLPIWHVEERPEWLTDELVTWLSLLDWGEESRPLVWPERILGANCSFRKSIFPVVGFFDTQLGRKGRALLGNEDTEIQERIHEDGKLVYYAAKAIVHHHIPPERVTEQYFLRRQYGAARSQMALLIKKEGTQKAAKMVLKDSWSLIKRLQLIAKIKYRHGKPVPFLHKRMLRYFWGHIVGFAETVL